MAKSTKRSRKLPDISDLLDAREDLEKAVKRHDSAVEKLAMYSRMELARAEDIVGRYGAANIKAEDCDHPVLEAVDRDYGFDVHCKYCKLRITDQVSHVDTYRRLFTSIDHRFIGFRK